MNEAPPKALLSTRIPYRETGYFSKLICDYLDGHEGLKSLYTHRPNLEGMQAAVSARKAYEAAHPETKERRQLLGKCLSRQYESLGLINDDTSASIQLLANGAWAIVTAHQLNLFTGPLYMIFKAVSAIKLARQLSAAMPEERFVPVFYLGSEDHDFEEINHFRLFGKSFSWERAAEGASGRMNTEGLASLHSQLVQVLGDSPTATELAALFKAAYLEHDSLGKAQQFLMHSLLGDEGLLVLDADEPELKASFAPVMAREFHESIGEKFTAAALAKLEAEWKVQAKPRDINLFYLKEKSRERITRTADGFELVESGEQIEKAEMLRMLNEQPENFSPNVILRPLYQDWILPSIAYIGGGGELAYWFELKELFEATEVPFPVLLLRNSALLVDGGSRKKLDKLGLDVSELFDRKDMVLRNWLLANETEEVNLTAQKKQLEELFQAIAEKAGAVDPTLSKRALAEGQQQLKSLGKLEGQLIKAAKQRHELSLNQIEKLHEKLFPTASLQERKDNFAAFYLKEGKGWIPSLIEAFEPLDLQFTVLG